MRIVMSWSGGKDSAYALWRLQRDAGHAVAGLLTTVTEGYDRISMHGVRESLLMAQARALGLPLFTVPIPPDCPNHLYEARLGEAVRRLLGQGVTALGFGDLFLEDIRAYRERQCAAAGIAPVFPIWGEPTAALARRMIGEGFRAILCCIDPRRLGREFAGRAYDRALLEALPPDVDPCGEYGEFHTFVHVAPNMTRPIPVIPGEVVERDGFVFADLVPGVEGAGPGEEPA
jgi:uncharacterized protein (TIGR00290 family)